MRSAECPACAFPLPSQTSFSSRDTIRYRAQRTPIQQISSRTLKPKVRCPLDPTRRNFNELIQQAAQTITLDDQKPVLRDSRNPVTGQAVVMTETAGESTVPTPSKKISSPQAVPSPMRWLTRSTRSNPSSTEGGTNFAAIRSIAKSGTTLRRAAFRALQTVKATSNTIASIEHPCSRAIRIKPFRSRRVRFVAST